MTAVSVPGGPDSSDVSTKTDPRVRLLGGPGRPTADTGAREQELLAALDDVAIRVCVGDDVDDAHLSALLVLLGLCARIFGDVGVDRPFRAPTNWWSVTTSDQMIASARRLRSAPQRTAQYPVLITFGTVDDPVPHRHRDRIGIGGDDWVAALSPRSAPCRPATHGLGLHTAVCLAVAQVLGRVLALAGHGARPAPVDQAGYSLDLITHRPLADPDPRTWPDPGPPDPAARARAALPIAVAGVGSVGTSVAALLATGLSTALAAAAPADGLDVTCIDADTFDPGRNPFRYPALNGDETGAKATTVAARLTGHGIRAHGHRGGVASWVATRARPGFVGILVSSVDTIDGRLDVADALARETLSIGVDGLALHVQREHLGDGLACPGCDFVEAAPPTTQAQAYADVTGLAVERVLQLLDQHTGLSADDVVAAAAASRIPAAHASSYVGSRLEDLLQRAYAEAAVNPAPAGGANAGADPDASGLAIAAPHVSWIAGALAVAEIVKELDGHPRLDRRVDLDLAGLPPGLVRRRPADPTGRCVCRGAVRARWMDRMYP